MRLPPFHSMTGRFLLAGAAAFVLAGVLLLMAMTDGRAGYRAQVLYLLGLGIVCAIIAYALRAPDPDEASASGEQATEFSPDVTDFARSAMASEMPVAPHAGANDSTMA